MSEVAETDKPEPIARMIERHKREPAEAMKHADRTQRKAAKDTEAGLREDAGMGMDHRGHFRRFPGMT